MPFQNRWRYQRVAGMKENKGVTSVITVNGRADDQQKTRDKGRPSLHWAHCHWRERRKRWRPQKYITLLLSEIKRALFASERWHEMSAGLSIVAFYLYADSTHRGTGQAIDGHLDACIMVSLSCPTVFYGRFSRVTSTVKPHHFWALEYSARTALNAFYNKDRANSFVQFNTDGVVRYSR